MDRTTTTAEPPAKETPNPEPSPETTRTSSYFDNVPSGYGDPKPEPKPIPQEEKPDPIQPEAEAEEVKPADEKPETQEKQKKTPAQYAEERRRAKEEREKMLKEYPELKDQLTHTKEELEALRKQAEENTGAVVEKEESIEVLREQLKQADERYIATYSPKINPYEDDQVKQYAQAVDDALRANIPRFAKTIDGEDARTNFDAVIKDPDRKPIVDQAVNAYSMAAQQGDVEAMDKAVALLGGALGNFDLDDPDSNIRQKLDAALNSAIDPLSKGISRFNEVQQNASRILQEQRAAAIKQTEENLSTPFNFDPESVEKALAENESNAWANFGKAFHGLDDQTREQLETEIMRDAQVVGQMQIQPPPLPQNASSEDIQKHQSLIRANQQRAEDIGSYIAVGRAMIDGGLLPQLMAEVNSAKARLEQYAEGEAIPGTSEGSSESEDSNIGIYEQVPSSYRQAS